MAGGPLTEARLASVIDDVAARLRLDAAGARRLKFTNNAVVALPRAGVLLRVAGSSVARQRIVGVLAAARWFAEAGIPAVRLVGGLEQPVVVNGGDLVTVWELVPSRAPDPTPEDLARILTALHGLPGTRDGVPRWEVSEIIERRLRLADELDDDTRAFLDHELAAVQQELAALSGVQPLIPPGVVHGDAHLGNLVRGRQGVLICDFDSTSIGPREWDLVPGAVGALRFGDPDRVHERLVGAYGVDVTTWPGFPALRRLRELQLVTSVLPVLEANPALRPQWEYRLATFRRRDEAARWTRYSAVAGV